MLAFRGLSRQFRCIAVLSILPMFLMLLFAPSPALPGEHPMHEGHEGMSMNSPMDSVMRAQLLADKRESEFNHHCAGFFVAMAGILILLEASLHRRWPSIRFAWPACFLLSGLFLLVFSDTELWPFQDQSWLQKMATNPEVLQHKIFAVILLGLGFVELERARSRLKAAWSAWVFPAFTFVGSSLLLFHSHDAAMHGPDHMALMAHIQSEHLSFAVTGFGIGLAKGVAEIPTRWQVVFQKLWPALLIVLGVLLLFYTE